eukprot:15442831-Alexandrium_andersonii.AAC.1
MRACEQANERASDQASKYTPNEPVHVVFGEFIDRVTRRSLAQVFKRIKDATNALNDRSANECAN